MWDRENTAGDEAGCRQDGCRQDGCRQAGCSLLKERKTELIGVDHKQICHPSHDPANGQQNKNVCVIIIYHLGGGGAGVLASCLRGVLVHQAASHYPLGVVGKKSTSK